jgi:hypothetical protein
MHRIYMIVAAAAMAAALPQAASAQNASAPPAPGSIQAKVKSNLEQSGFTNVQIMPSSFLVRAMDKDGNPVMMVINPDSITAITDVNANQQANGGSSGQPNLTSTQRSEIWQSLSAEAKQIPPAGFTPQVGEVVPNSLGLHPLPASLANKVPALKSDDYAMLQNEVLIVDPSSKKILSIIIP